ncbi:unnamed protein product [Nippostrongylus brasiliensis]|uniref:Tubulin--tyrosine ligase-like protein 12 (inferred by orthology to a C. elegans protein) n=1 Tax=Nippostrongylus brasiliensis TaxID=27835 RepID=A0A158R0X6_NIPBR|nr:unnamed protein product [Nippostrongylus brasiliensis]
MEFGDYRFDHFLHGHKDQLEAGGVPPELWGSLYTKLMQQKNHFSLQTFDAGNYFRILCEETDDGRNWSVFATKDLHPVDEYNIFLIDHAWTFRPHQARAQLEQLPQLVDRMKNLLDIQTDESGCPESDSEDEVTTDEQERLKVEQQLEASSSSYRILRKMWKYIQTYTVRFKQEVDEEGMPLWYIMDEFGVRISHSDSPNVRVVPLFFIPHNAAYSVVFLTKEVADGEEICRDYADHSMARKQPDWRQYFMVPWLDDESVPNEKIERQPPDENFFLSGRNLDVIPSEAAQQQAAAAIKNRDLTKPLRVYADGLQMIDNLSAVKFTEVSDWHNADVLWLKRHFREYEYSPMGKLSCLTVKDLLSAIVMDQNSGEPPAWYQTCFNLNTELPQFISHYLHRKSSEIKYFVFLNRWLFSGLDNTWIIKPWNLARGMDMHVSNDLRQIIRLTESGPKIACKYIERPVLFLREDNNSMVKFDLRYIVFVNQVRPLHRLDDIETHFTVFNYGDGDKVLQMKCDDFIKRIEETHPSIKWANVQKQNVQSRAMYGADVMLQWTGNEEKEVQPTLLEFNFMPDCERACRYYPDFADTVFRTLFMNEIDSKLVSEI